VSFLAGIGSIPPKNRDTNTPAIYQQGYQQIGRIPAKTSERPRWSKRDLDPSLLVIMNAGG
jgi:hypothetical protein